MAPPQAGPAGQARASYRVLLDGDRRLKHGRSIQSVTVSSVSGRGSATVAETAFRARCCCLRRLRLSRRAAAWRARCSAWLRQPDCVILGALFGGSLAMAGCCDASRAQVKPSGSSRASEGPAPPGRRMSDGSGARGSGARDSGSRLAPGRALIDDAGKQLRIARPAPGFHQPADPGSETSHREPPRVATSATASEVLAPAHDQPMAGRWHFEDRRGRRVSDDRSLIDDAQALHLRLDLRIELARGGHVLIRLSLLAQLAVSEGPHVDR
jgi:hypothetical protein